MYSGNSNNRSSPLYDYSDLYHYDFYDTNEEEENCNMLLRMATDNPNNIRSCGPHKIVKDVSVQTIPEIDEIYIPWLLEAERRVEDFYVQLCNLVNSLYHSQSKAIKTKSKAYPPLSSSIIKNIPPEKSCGPNTNTKNSGYGKLPEIRSENLAPTLPYQVIEDKIHAMLKSAMELKSAIPKVGSELLDEIIEQEYEIVKTKTVKETNVLKLERSKSSTRKEGSSPQQVYKSKKGSTLSTVSESKFVTKRRTREVFESQSHGTGTSDSLYSVPKSKNVASARNTAPGTSRSASNTKVKQASPPDKVPTKDTGAIPKVREERRVAGASTVIRNQKAKKTNDKPIWK